MLYLHTMEYLEQRFGFEITYIKPENQEITAQQIKEALRPDTILLVSCMPITTDQTTTYKGNRFSCLNIVVFHVDAVPSSWENSNQTTKNLVLIFCPLLPINSMDRKGIGFYSSIHKFDSLIHGGSKKINTEQEQKISPAIARMHT